MFEQAISELESMGIPFEETEDGSLMIDISSADKTDVVTIVSFLNDTGMEYSIDASSIVVMGGAPEMAEEDFSDEGMGDAMSMALEDMM
jgi:succinate dehydrogenase/fumarate reductase flavoprotein subunit